LDFEVHKNVGRLPRAI